MALLEHERMASGLDVARATADVYDLAIRIGNGETGLLERFAAANDALRMATQHLADIDRWLAVLDQPSPDLAALMPLVSELLATLNTYDLKLNAAEAAFETADRESWQVAVGLTDLQRRFAELEAQDFTATQIQDLLDAKQAAAKAVKDFIRSLY